jgi:DNA-binding CsgD family transcriptional regulator
MLDEDVRAQELADPDSLRHARMSAGERMEVLTELVDEYSTTLESILAVLRSGKVDDSAARSAATAVAASGLVHLRTASDRVRTSAEEAVTSAFERLREDLRPLVHYRDIDVQFVEPPEDGRPLPSEVAHGARAVVRGAVLALLESPDVGRVRVQWDCDGTNLLIDMRDDGRGDVTGDSVSMQSVSQRLHALGGRISTTATPGWGTEIAIVIPLDPPQTAPGVAEAWELRPREHDVLRRLAAGKRNREIAADLAISENTVKFHVANIYRKLDVSSRSEATALFLRT